MATGPAPWTLHLMSLVWMPAEAAITVAMRMHWPPDGSAVDLEVAGPGPQHMPYAGLHAEDDQGARYAIRFEGGPSGTATWLGVVRLSPVPPPATRRLDLTGDGTRLLRVALGSPVPTAPSGTERRASTPGDHLLALEAERLLAGGGARGPVEGPSPGEVVTMLMAAGAIAADSPVPGQLAALCQRLGVAGHGITVPPSPHLPAPWASVLRVQPPGDAETFVPLACVLPDIDGTRFALAVLSTAAGERNPGDVSAAC